MKGPCFERVFMAYGFRLWGRRAFRKHALGEAVYDRVNGEGVFAGQAGHAWWVTTGGWAEPH